MGKDRSSWMIYVYGLLPCAGGLGFGYDTGSMSGILAMPQFLTYMGDPGNFLQGENLFRLQIQAALTER